MKKSARLPGDGKFVLVTGAYGGMGRASVLSLRSLGYTVFAMDLTVCEPEDGIIPVLADLTDEESIKKGIQRGKCRLR